MEAILPWDDIKHDYEVEGLNTAEIARKYNCCASTVYRKALTDIWSKPAKKQEVEPIPDSPSDLVDDDDDDEDNKKEEIIAIDANQLTIEDAIYRQKCLLARLMYELETSTSHIGQMKKWILEGTKEDRSISRRRAMYQAVSMGNRTIMLKNATVALKNLCEIEGMAGIKPKGKKANLEAEANEINKDVFSTPDAPSKIAA